MNTANAVISVIFLAAWTAAMWHACRAAGRIADAATPMSGEVAGQHIREALHAELAAAGLEAPGRADGLEELWEASP